MSYNVRSVSKNLDSFLGSFSDSVHLPDMIALSETWFENDTIKEIPSYSSSHTVRESKRSGGISIFIKRHYYFSPLESLCFATDNIEVNVVEIKVNTDKLIVIAIYRPHDGNFGGFLDDLNIILNNSHVLNRKILLLGDLNINLIADTNNVVALKNFFNSFHFFPVITKPTRFPPSGQGHPSLIDHIWYNDIKNYECGILLHDFTDHLPIFIHIPFTNNTNINSLIKVHFRCINEANREEFDRKIRLITWDTVENNNIDLCLESLITKVNDLYLTCFPIKIKYISLKRFTNAWMTQQIFELISAKSEYFIMYKLGFISQAENNLYKNKVNKIVNKTKTAYFKRLFERNSNNIKNTWKHIRNITSNQNSKIPVRKLIVNGNEINSDKEIAEIFNNFFSSIASELEADVPVSEIDPITYLNAEQHISQTCFLNPVTVSECSNYMINLKNTKQGLYAIPIWMLKKYCFIVAPQLTKVIN